MSRLRWTGCFADFGVAEGKTGGCGYQLLCRAWGWVRLVGQGGDWTLRLRIWEPSQVALWVGIDAGVVRDSSRRSLCPLLSLLAVARSSRCLLGRSCCRACKISDLILRDMHMLEAGEGRKKY